MNNKNLVTCIYYTSNREKESFEKRIQENILKYCGDLPIISVSQKPIDFGKNICIGNVGASGFNCFRQILIACEAATTKFVLSIEADCLYPPDYFEFIPERDDICYRNSNLYVMPDQRPYFFHKKEGATHAQIVGREFYIKTLKKLFEGSPQWNSNEKNFPKERHRKEDIFGKNEIEHYKTKNPICQIKTHRGLRYYTRSSRIPIHELPFWGSGEIFRTYYLHGNKIKTRN